MRSEFELTKNESKLFIWLARKALEIARNIPRCERVAHGLLNEAWALVAQVNDDLGDSEDALDLVVQLETSIESAEVMCETLPLEERRPLQIAIAAATAVTRAFDAIDNIHCVEYLSAKR